MQSSSQMPNCDIPSDLHSNKQSRGNSALNIWVNNKVKRFKSLILDGPYFICVVCNRSLYHRSVIIFSNERYPSLNSHHLTFVKSFDNKFYVCKTCDSKMIKGKIPCQIVSNKLEIYDLPPSLQNVRRLEKTLIARRLLFKKNSIMPKGQFPKIKGTICNVPIDTVDICNTLPQPADSNGLVIVKLKRKLQYRGHVFFDAVRPRVIQRLLQYLKIYNPLYHDIEINISHTATDLILINNNTSVCTLLDINVDVDQSIPIEIASADEYPGSDSVNDEELTHSEFESFENPLDQHRLPANETALITSIPSVEEAAVIAPGEGLIPLSLLNDKNCEELAFPYLFPTGKFGCFIKRDVPLSPVKYFNQRLLNYTQKFASDSDYIFYAHSVWLKLNLYNQINIAMRKTSGHGVTAGMLSENFKEKVKHFITTDSAFAFMNSIKGTPAYWKKFLLEVLAMVKKLGTPTFF